MSNKRRLRLEERARLREEMNQVLYDIAQDEVVPPQTRVLAADRLLDRIDGKPPQLNVAADLSDVRKLSDAELHQIAARGLVEQHPKPAQPLLTHDGASNQNEVN